MRPSATAPGRRAIPLFAAAGALAVLLALLGGASVASAAVVPRPDGGPRARVQPVATLPAGASVGGSVASSATIGVTISLQPSDPSGLAAYAQAVADPASPLYRHYLTVAQFAARFGADPSGVAAVRSALEQSGLTVGPVSANGLSLTATGTAAEVEGAFGTSLSHVSLPDGDAAYTDTETPTLPSAVAAAVQSVAGLDSLPVQTPEGLVADTRARHARASSDAQAASQVTSAGAAQDCTGADGVAAGYGANTAQEIGSAYGFDGLWSEGDTGAGTTVALVEFEPYTSSYVSAYQSCYGTHATVTNVAVSDGTSSGAACNGDAECGAEDELDIEDVIGLAPSAAIDVYEAPNTSAGSEAVYTKIVTSDAAQVVSTSWGECETDMTRSERVAENTLFQEAETQGQTVLAAAGDSGADDCGSGSASVDDPASQPYVTGVGGTTLSGTYADPADEAVWNDASGASGGGASSVWTRPSYQSSDVSGSMREVPDVSADADPDTGYAMYAIYENAQGRVTHGWVAYGGTSAAAPTWGALAALADSSSDCSASVGFLNPALYELPGTDFYDVTSGDNTYDGVTGYSATTGYDPVSGLGAPNGAALIPALCGSATKVTSPTTTSTTTTQTTTTTTPATTVPTTTAAPTQTTPAPVGTTPPPPTAGARTPLVRFAAHPARRTVRLGRRVRLVLRARDRAGLRLRYSARRLPRGLRIDARTGVISGRPTRPGRSVSSITARDTRGDAGTIVIRWMVRRR